MDNNNTNILVNSRDDKEGVWAKNPVTGRFVMDIADRTELRGRFAACIEHVVRSHVTELLQEVAQRDARFRGKLIPSGSFYEGTKVTTPNEFDFMYELRGFPPETVVPKHVLPPTVRPTQEETPHRGYFTLEVDPTTIESESNFTSNGIIEVIDADVIFQVFFESLETAARRQNEESTEQTMLSITNMKRNGPAVTLSFTTTKPMYPDSQECPNPWPSKWFKTVLSALKSGYTKHFHIKVDIVLAVPVLFTNLKLNEGHIETNFSEEDETEMLYLVPSGNCWKLSVAKQESRLIRTLIGVDWRPQENVIDCGEHSNSDLQSDNLDANRMYTEEEISDDVTRPLLFEMEPYGIENERVHNQLSDDRIIEIEAYRTQNECFHSRHSNEVDVAQKCRRSCLIALKHLRDEHESSDVMKKAILPTYPLKVAFVQECIDHPDDEAWTEDQLGVRVYNILDKVDAQSRDGSLTSSFLPNVPVLKSPNYNISKQVSSMKGALHKKFKHYRFVSGISVLACILGILAAGSIIYTMIHGAISFCCSEKNKFGNRCVFFNGTYPCKNVHLSNEGVLEILVELFALVSIIAQHIWYLGVILFRMVTWLCRCQRKLSFHSIPLVFQLIPLFVYVVFLTTAGFNSDGKYQDKYLVNIAIYETVYLLYEVACLLYICLLRQRNQSVNECFDPCRKLTRIRVKRPVEPYFEHVSKYSNCRRNSF